jgi:hypothetical protein
MILEGSACDAIGEGIGRREFFRQKPDQTPDALPFGRIPIDTQNKGKRILAELADEGRQPLFEGWRRDPDGQPLVAISAGQPRAGQSAIDQPGSLAGADWFRRPLWYCNAPRLLVVMQ